MLRSLNNYRMLIYGRPDCNDAFDLQPEGDRGPRAHLFIIPEKEDRRGGVNHGNAGCKNLSISFGGLKAVDDFSITIEKGQLYGLIGPNGAGKTTIFNLLTGVYKPDGGRILLDGKDITGHKAIQINQAGIARTFQNIRLFKELSV